MNKNKNIAFLILLLFTIVSFAQSVTIKGNIKDAKTDEPLIGVNIVEKDGAGTVTDFEGNYELTLEGKDAYEITYSYLGYKDIVKIFSNNQSNYTTDINLEEEAILLGDEVVITGSLFEKKASEEVISIEVVKPDLIANVNPTRIDEALRRVSGMNVADGQANIRAGSGWAYGVGSRVAFILDGQPVLSPDRGDIKWNQLPLESVGQIEVLKGASSVLYGSSAMNGTIHLQTLKPTKTPITKFTAFQSFIAPPKRKETKWWDFPIPSFGASFVRAHKPKDNFEYLVGGSFFLQNTPYEGGEEYLARMYYKTKWTSKKNDRISYGVNGSLMYNREYEYFFWENRKKMVHLKLN
ncbi:MAG: TonB-dependent receptor plug domain-containing protein [Chitinophagales bacterium]